MTWWKLDLNWALNVNFFDNVLVWEYMKVNKKNYPTFCWIDLINLQFDNDMFSLCEINSQYIWVKSTKACLEIYKKSIYVYRLLKTF